MAVVDDSTIRAQEPFWALSSARLARADRTNGARLIRGSAVNKYGCYRKSAVATERFSSRPYLQEVMGRCSFLRINLESEVQEVLEHL